MEVVRTMILVSSVLFVSFSARAFAQTTCSVKVPVPSLDVCDATGTLEEHVDASVHETRGRIKSMEDFGGETFQLFNQQFNSIVDDSTNTDMDIKDVEEMILVLKRYVANLQDARDVKPEVQNARGRRAATTTPTPPSLQTLNAAKASFQQTVASLMQKLNNISAAVQTDITNDASVHIQLKKELTTNFQSLSALENQIQTLGAKVQSALNGASGTTSGGVNLSSVTQEVTDLVINASVAEQVIQRQLDDLTKLNAQLQATEHATGTKLALYNSDFNILTQNATDLGQEAMILQGGERLYEDKVGAFIANGTQDLANARAELGVLQKDIKSQSNTVLQATIRLGGFEQNLKSLRQSVDSVQSVVTFSKNAQQTEIADILLLKKALTDSINTLKYAFGLRTTPP